MWQDELDGSGVSLDAILDNEDTQLTEVSLVDLYANEMADDFEE